MCLVTLYAEIGARTSHAINQNASKAHTNTHDFSFQVNYQRSRLPISLIEGKLQLYQYGSSVFVETDFSLKISFDWKSHLVVKISNRFSENLCGLCGDYNGDPDDFIIPDGTLAPSPVEFGQSWKVLRGQTSCRDDCQGKCKSFSLEVASKYKDERFCGLIIKEENGPFSHCHSVIDPEIFLDNCVYDLYMNDGSKNTLCETLENYADACQREGVTVSNWRSLVGCCEYPSVLEKGSFKKGKQVLHMGEEIGSDMVDVR